MTKNMYTVAGDGPCNEELALRIQAGDKNAAERLIAQNEGYLTELARAYTPWCEMEDLKQEAALALLDAAGHFDPAYGTKLLTYATPAIEAALSDYAAQHSSSLSIPISRYNAAKAEAEQAAGHGATPQRTWWGEKELMARFICEVVSLIRVHEIFSDTLENIAAKIFEES